MIIEMSFGNSDFFISRSRPSIYTSGQAFIAILCWTYVLSTDRQTDRAGWTDAEGLCSVVQWFIHPTGMSGQV